MAFDVTSLLSVLPVTAREITRDETSISWRKVKLRLSVSRSNAPSPESVHEDLPDYEDAPEASSHTNDRGGAEDDEESEEEDELEDENDVASDIEPSNPLPASSCHLPSALGLDFTSPIDLTQDDPQAQVLSQLARIDLRDSTDKDSSAETRLREAEAFIASAVLSQSLAPTSLPPSPPDEPLHENHKIQSTTMTVRRVGRYETIYGLSSLSDGSDDEPYFELSRPGITRWSSSPTTTSTFTTTSPTKARRRTPAHRELSLHPRLPSFLSIIPRYHRTYSSTWFTKNTRVKRILEARERRRASNPAVGGAGTSFVKKAVERFGPSWRPRLPSVFRYGLRKKKANESSVDVVSNSERMRAGKDIERPANVPRTVDATELTVPSAMDALPAEDKPTEASLSIQSDTTMVVQGDEDEVPECIVVPSTPPPSLPFPPPPLPLAPQPPLPYLNTHSHSQTSQLDYPYVTTPPLESRKAHDSSAVCPITYRIPAHTGQLENDLQISSTSQSQSVPLPYLASQTSPDNQLDYPCPDNQLDYPCPYIPTPPLDPISLPTPRLTREASFASSNVPTPESGRVALPVDGLGVPSVEENLGTKSVKYGSPSADDGVAYPYIATPPLPSSTSSSPIVPPSLPGSFTPLPNINIPSISPQPMPIIPPTLIPPTLPTAVPVPAPPLSAVLPSFPVGQPPPPLPPLHPPAPIIPPTLTLPTQPTTAQPPPLTTVLPSFPVGQPPPPLPPLIPPLTVPPRVPSLSVVPPIMTSQPPSSGFFHRLESQTMTRPPPLSSEGSGSGLAPQSFMPPTGPSLSSTAPTPALHLQIPPPSRITESAAPSESMDCREDAYAPLVTMTSPVEQPCIPIPDCVMGEEGGLYAAVGQDAGQINTGLLGANSGELTTHAVVDGPSYQGALDSGYTSRKEGKGKQRATDEDGLDGDPPPFDESDPLWEKLLAYKADPHGDVLASSPCVDVPGLGQEVAGILGGDPTGAFDLGSPNTSWDFSAVLDSADSNLLDQSQEDAVWKELCAWANEQPPEMLKSVFGMLDTSQSFVAEEPSVEPVGFGDFPPLDESQPLELLVPTITVEPPYSPPPSASEHYHHPQLVQGAPDFKDKRETGHGHPSKLEASTSFTLDELDWAVMEEYAQLEDLECPSSSVDAARVMVIAIRAVAAKAKTGFAGTSDGQAFLPVVEFRSGPCGIVGGQSVSPSYEYISLLDEDAQAPLVSPHYHQPSRPPTCLAHVFATS